MGIQGYSDAGPPILPEGLCRHEIEFRAGTIYEFRCVAVLGFSASGSLIVRDDSSPVRGLYGRPDNCAKLFKLRYCMLTVIDEPEKSRPQ